jgi:AcrR family transcriptional regulator
MATAEQNDVGTRERIIDAAEALFAEKGFDLVSLRDITSQAGANVAAVNYHFGSKDNLISAVVERHCIPIIEGRMRMLSEAEERHGENVVPLEEILRAFLQPLLDHLAANEFNEALFCKFMGRMSGDQSCMPDSVAPLFQKMASRYSFAIRKAVPALSDEEALWRIHFSFGVVAHGLMHGETLYQISGGKSGHPSMEVLLDRVIRFCVGGIQAEAER